MATEPTPQASEALERAARAIAKLEGFDTQRVARAAILAFLDMSEAEMRFIARKLREASCKIPDADDLFDMARAPDSLPALDASLWLSAASRAAIRAMIEEK